MLYSNLNYYNYKFDVAVNFKKNQHMKSEKKEEKEYMYSHRIH